MSDAFVGLLLMLRKCMVKNTKRKVHREATTLYSDGASRVTAPYLFMSRILVSAPDTNNSIY
jgi:hypothetical protein